MKEINNQQNAGYAARRPANNSNPIEESLVRRVENNRRRNERNRLYILNCIFALLLSFLI